MTRWAAQIPNALTIARLALTPWLFSALAHRDFPIALELCLLAGASDALDGYLARRFSWSSRFGAYLDPVADKFMLSAVYLALAWAGVMPFFFVWILFGRDLFILFGTAFLYLITPIRNFPPTIWGKLSTACLIAVALGLIATAATLRLSPERLDAISRVTVGITLGLTVLSGLHYLLRGVRALWRIHRGELVQRLD